MLSIKGPYSAYESCLSPLDIRYIENAVPRELLTGRRVLFRVVMQDDYATDTKNFRLEWATANSPKRKECAVSTLEELAQRMTAIWTLEQ